MNTLLLDSLDGIQNFLMYFGSSLVLFAAFCWVYCWLTPYDEYQMIKQGQTAPAISFGGAMLGFVLPLASAISESLSLVDMLIWALIAMTVQCILFWIVRIMFKELVKQIEQNSSAAATLLAAFSIAIGILNAASLTY